ncbi:GntR family transcriptional regulator [Frondihabitans sp. VKM Ac-2883]|jgi:DNA-binding GntR family transcriptional regulator|uniref:GntR family transcriptional regulator n=1 Tax=unclassified Frondihabitans TaxID=2626248 RepID=UPI001E3A15F1|nr:GntR family transcriptional regulator [Frondihabitans sp. VKM Ac-2883]
MPVPRPTPENQEPRRLLRDVVYDKMFLAILDGTLELGERLNDDELVRWLGVSRTPVREAIAKLAEQGLVDIEANRYTRVVAPSFEQFTDTIRTGYDLWSIVMKRGVPNLTDADRTFVVNALGQRAKDLAAHKREDLATLDAFNLRVVTAANSPMLSRLWAATGPLTALLFQRAGAKDIFPFEPGATFSKELAKAIKANDADRAAELVSNQPDNFHEFYEAVRESGIYPA